MSYYSCTSYTLGGPLAAISLRHSDPLRASQRRELALAHTGVNTRRSAHVFAEFQLCDAAPYADFTALVKVFARTPACGQPLSPHHVDAGAETAHA